MTPINRYITSVEQDTRVVFRDEMVIAPRRVVTRIVGGSRVDVNAEDGYLTISIANAGGTVIRVTQISYDDLDQQ